MSFSVAVPNVPGVPSVNFAPIIGDLITFVEQDALGVFAGSFGNIWGLYLGIIPIIPADSVVQFSYKRSAAISDYPVEAGSFIDYDKVQIPFDARFRFAISGSQSRRQTLLAALEAIVDDTLLYNVVTPDAVYLNVNINNIEYNRNATAGLSLLQVDVWALQVIVAPTAQTTDAVNPSDASQANFGQVQAIAPTAQQIAKIPTIAGVSIPGGALF